MITVNGMGYICTILTFTLFLTLYSKSKKSTENDLINEYGTFFSKTVIEYGGKCPSMKEKRLDYLNK